jgi:hypothetical protein
MSEFQELRVMILRLLAFLQAAVDSNDDDVEMRETANLAIHRARLLMRRRQISDGERDQLEELLGWVRRVVAVLPSRRAA